jgi:pyridoxine/pyridoxamine 5'-phosphate oxidase
MTKEQLFLFMSGHKLAVLSTISPQGTPQSALVGIAVTTDLEIVFDTVKSSRKYPNLIANPAAAFVVGCTDETTLQYEGQAREPHAEEADKFKAVYFAAWPDGPSRQGWPGICYFVVKPKWIRFSDYDRTPAVIEETRFY